MKASNDKIKKVKIPEFCKTALALSKAMHVGRNTLRNLMANKDFPMEHPGKGWSVSEVLKYVKESTVKNHWSGDMARADIVELRAMQLRAQISKLEHEVAVNQNRYIRRDIWAPAVVQIFSDFDRAFQKHLEQDLPSALEGLPAIKIRDALREAYNELKGEMNERLSSIGD